MRTIRMESESGRWCRTDATDGAGGPTHRRSRRGIPHDDGASGEVDLSWSASTDALEYKAWKAGVQCKRVSPAYTSTDCSKCGHRQKMALSQRTFNCAVCELRLCRDVNATKNIRSRGFPGSGGTFPDAATCVLPLPSVGKTSSGLALVAQTDAAERYAETTQVLVGI